VHHPITGLHLSEQETLYW